MPTLWKPLDRSRLDVRMCSAGLSRCPALGGCLSLGLSEALHYALCTSSILLILLHSLHALNSSFIFFAEPWLSQIPYIWFL